MKFKFKRVDNSNSKDFLKLYEKFSRDTIWFKKEKERSGEPELKRILKKDLIGVIVYDGENPIAFNVFDINFKSTKRGYLNDLFIDRKYRNHDLAEFIRKRTVNILKKLGVKEIITRTWSKNKAMIHLNEKTGFKLYRTIKNDRKDGSDTLWFRKEIG